MTVDEVTDVLAIVSDHWPNARLGDPRDAVRTWHAVLGRFETSDVQAALERLLSREWAPRAGQVAAEVQLALQGDPPPFDEVAVQVMRAQHWLPYDPWGRYSPEDTARAVAVLEARGVHEAIQRFVQQRGLGAVLMMPWAGLVDLDPNQSADHRDMARSYRDQTVPGWRRDPRPGRALQRAAQTARLDAGELLGLAAGEQSEHQERLQAAREQLALPAAPEAAGGQEDDDPMVEFDFEEFVESYRAGRAQADAEREAERAARRAAENEAYRAAHAELAEHAARTGASR